MVLSINRIMNRKNQLLREFFLNALTIALMKQIIVAGLAEEPGRNGAGSPERQPSGDVPPYFQG